MSHVKHWPTCPHCGTSMPHVLVSVDNTNGPLIRCGDCNRHWYKDDPHKPVVLPSPMQKEDQ